MMKYSSGYSNNKFEPVKLYGFSIILIAVHLSFVIAKTFIKLVNLAFTNPMARLNAYGMGRVMIFNFFIFKKARI